MIINTKNNFIKMKSIHKLKLKNNFAKFRSKDMMNIFNTKKRKMSLNFF